MSALYIFINGSLSKRLFWAGPVIIFLLVLLTRTVNVAIVNALCAFAAYVFGFVLMFFGIKDIFPSEDELRREVLFYRGFGMNFFSQFLFRALMVLFWTFIIYFMTGAVLWSFFINMFFLMYTVAFSLLMFSALQSILNNKFIYYIPVFLYAGSLFYPLYLVPNTAYVMNSGLEDLLIYSGLYLLLYFLLSYKLYFYSWRRQCTL